MTVMPAPGLSLAWRWFFGVVAVAAIACLLAALCAFLGTFWGSDDEPTPAPVVPPARMRHDETLRAAADVQPVPAMRVRITGLGERINPRTIAIVRPTRDETIGRDQYRGSRARQIAQMQGERR